MIKNWKVYERGGRYRIGIPTPDPFQRWELEYSITWYHRPSAFGLSEEEVKPFETNTSERALNVLDDINKKIEDDARFKADHWKEIVCVREKK